MTESESIKICNTIGFATSFSNPKGIPLNTTKEELAEAMRMAIQALEKQIQKKPRKTDSYRGILKRVYAYVCPTCGNACLEKYMNERQDTMFCWNCGQKLDWEDDDDD